MLHASTVYAGQTAIEAYRGRSFISGVDVERRRGQSGSNGETGASPAGSMVITFAKRLLEEYPDVFCRCRGERSVQGCEAAPSPRWQLR
jgi:hypothetical protein